MKLLRVEADGVLVELGDLPKERAMKVARYLSESKTPSRYMVETPEGLHEYRDGEYRGLIQLQEL